MIKPSDLRECVIRPVLLSLARYRPAMGSREAEELLMLTAATESHLGYYLKQTRGPALSIYQIEPATHKDVLRFIATKPDLAEIVGELAVKGSHDELVWNLAYATAIARVKYWMASGPIPTTLEGQAHYWKRVYNTPLGRGTVEEALAKYKRYVING